MGLAPRRYSLSKGEFYAPLTIMRLEGEPSGLGGPLILPPGQKEPAISPPHYLCTSFAHSLCPTWATVLDRWENGAQAN